MQGKSERRMDKDFSETVGRRIAGILTVVSFFTRTLWWGISQRRSNPSEWRLETVVTTKEGIGRGKTEGPKRQKG